LRISAFRNRNVEICTNGIDDDGDGLVDCDDPDCFGVGMCGAPACTPDMDLGALSVGSKISATVDTRNAPDFYNAGCGKGDGPERVLRFEVTQVLSLGVDCTDTGSHVLSLSAQVNALDRCDADTHCTDPGTLPFGCGYSIPDVQPGTYNFIVEAFSANTTGVVGITFTGIRQTVTEICDNGIDDDGDGFTDCMDRKCVAEAACQKFACRPDKQLDILPLDGSMVLAVVQTTAAGDDQTKTTCVSAPGGQDAVVDFQVPARADITLQWAQIGSHAFALYTNDGMIFSCEAGTLLDCTSTGGQATGQVTFMGVPAGLYHLVVDADHPGAEGGVTMQLSGKAAP